MKPTRYFILVPLLVASHGLVIWAGVAKQGPSKEALSAPVGEPAAVTEEKVTLSQFRDPKGSKASLEKGAVDHDETYQRWLSRYKAALKSIAANADVAAMVKTGITDKYADVSPEALAAFTLWLERDAEAALRWHFSFYGWSDSGKCGLAFRAYVESHALADLNALLLSVPDARHGLLDTARSLAGEQGLDEVMKLAASLSNAGDRRSVLVLGASSADGLGPYLAVIRGYLDEAGMREFLWNLANREHAGDLRDAVRVAGFSEEALRAFDEQLAKSAEDRRTKALGMVGLLREGGLFEQGKASQFEVMLNESVPEFREWCQDFEDSRISADEVMSRLKDGIPGSDGSDDAMCEFVFCKLYHTDPEAAVKLLREHHGDWQKVMKKGVSSAFVSVEKLQRIADSMSPEDLEACGLEQDLMYRYGDWYRRDPEHCVAAMEQLPESHLKKRVRDIMKYHDEQDAKLK